MKGCVSKFVSEGVLKEIRGDLENGYWRVHWCVNLFVVIDCEVVLLC